MLGPVYAADKIQSTRPGNVNSDCNFKAEIGIFMSFLICHLKICFYFHLNC